MHAYKTERRAEMDLRLLSLPAALFLLLCLLKKNFWLVRNNVKTNNCKKQNKSLP